MKKILGYILITIFLTGCSYYAKYQAYQQEQQTLTTRHYNLAYFDSIVVSGKMAVEIRKGYPSANSAAEKQFNDKITAQVKHHTLYLTLPNYIAGANVAAIINIPHLKSLRAENYATVTANNLTAATLEITANSHAQINLQGQLGVTKITQYSDGKIELSWIKSKKLMVEGYGHGLVLLSGRVKELWAKLRTNSQLDARYLRTPTATILATDVATAHVWVSDLLNAYTERQSNVYYYTIPQHLNAVSKDHSNVLHLDWIR